MMLNQLILELKQKDVHLYLNNGKLRCKAPPSVLTPDLKVVLQNHKAELTELLLGSQSHECSFPKSVPRDGNLPLSFSQERLWFLDQLASNNAFYNISGAIRLLGALDTLALSKSLNEIINRHEVLRTTFSSREGGNVEQIIAPAMDLGMVVVDLSTVAEDKRKMEISRYLTEEARRPFDLSQGPLVRATLLFLGAPTAPENAEHILLFTLHHIISDGWSTGILIREFITLYEAFRQSQPSPLPELTIQYADYAVWQRNWLQGGRLAQQLNYWTKQLAGAPAVLELPTDRPRPTVQSYRGASYHFSVSQTITEQLKLLSRQEAATLFMVLLTSFNILLFRYSGQKDVCVGMPIANRNRVEIEGLIGLFVNTLVLRTDLSDNPAFTVLLRSVREICLGAQAHQDLPFEKLVEELAPARDMSHSPLFQVMFTLQNTPETQLDIDGLQIIPVNMDTGAVKFDLDLEMTEKQGGLDAIFNYNTDLFDESTIVRMAGHLERLLEAIVSAPDKRLHDLCLLTAPEREQLLLEWNATEASYSQDTCLHQLFEAQVGNSPDLVAVVFEDQQLTYGQLNAQANQLAHYLRAQGVGPEALVGICVERSLEMIVGILGILKAGGAYMPIDPNAPRERIVGVLEITVPVLVLSQQKLHELLPLDIKRFYLDTEWQKVSGEKPDNLAYQASPQNLAYVLYTSGSTGKPKGVAITHGNVVNSTLARLEYYLQPASSFLLLSSMTFDSSIAGLFGTLSQGGCLILPHDDLILDTKYLLQLISNHEISHMLAVPSLYKAVLNYPASAGTKSLKTVIVAGESCHQDLIDLHYQLQPQAQLFNEYGPTEVTVWSTVHRCKVDEVDQKEPVPIGRPIANTQIYLLDTYLNPVPIGVTGELHIGGVGLARGYQEHSALTAERFTPNPFSTEPGARLYRTGDLARYRTDGNIEFLGRSDHQVKIRGFRIELGEIEAALLQHAQIKEAVAIVREDTPEDKRLVAYVVSAKSAREIEDIRTQLKTRLPDYMIPTAFVFLDSLPLTSNGKVDRKALPVPDSSDQLIREYVAPRNSTEEIIANIWAEVLGVERVGIYDNFFELGGHSLLVMQLIDKINNELKLDLKLGAIFSHTTIAALVESIEQGEISDSDDIVAINLVKEAVLDPTIQPTEKFEVSNDDPANILLTGGTGFLGSFLLYELLQQTSADIYCLVRAKTDIEALNKLKNNLQQYGLLNAAFKHRIIPLCGDLSKPRLGLSSALFMALAGQIDAIYHNGALVNFVQPYAALKAANVIGTQEVLRLACSEKTKLVHYVSTLSVFGDDLPVDHRGFSEDDSLDVSAKLNNGYSQSKWVAERLINICSSRGLPVSIYRPATVTGHSQTGVWNSDDYLCRLIRGCINLGEAPAKKVAFNIVPVDYVSKAIINLSRKPSAIGKAFHLSNQHSANSLDIVNWINSLGYSVQLRPYSQWRKSVLEEAAQSNDHPLYPLLSIFTPNTADTETPDDFIDASAQYSCKQTQETLQGIGIQCPVPDRALFRVYLNYLQHKKLLTEHVKQADIVKIDDKPYQKYDLVS